MDNASSRSGCLTEAWTIVRLTEGCSLTAYPDPASPLARTAGASYTTWQQLLAAGSQLAGRPWTIGYGSTSHVDGSPILPHEQWIQGQANADLMRRLTVLFGEVAEMVRVPLPNGAYGALVSLAYNCGVTAERKSLRSGLIADLNAGNYSTAADDFLQYDHARGSVFFPLLKRREAERALFIDACVEAGLLRD